MRCNVLRCNAMNDCALRDRPGEAWRKVPGHGDLFHVSSHGRVKRARYVKMNGVVVDEGIVKQYVQRGKYAYVNLCYDGKQEGTIVAQLVAVAFIGKVKSNVIHVDGDTLNNNVDNLVYKNRAGVMIQENRSRRRVAMLDVTGNQLAVFASTYVAANLLFRSKGQRMIARCCEGKLHTVYGYRWVYLDRG